MKIGITRGDLTMNRDAKVRPVGKWGGALLLLSVAMAVSACGAADPSGVESTLSSETEAIQVNNGEYRFAPQILDSSVGPFFVEPWAHVWSPAFSGTQRYPLIVMVHGHHGSCGKNNTSPRVDDVDDYAFDGTCPTGYSTVQSHMGYAYLAADLAAKGYIVVSINAERGFSEDSPDDAGRVKAMGKLVLWHLKQLSQWDRGVTSIPAGLGINLRNRIDFGQVGLMGHSRGCLGMRYALDYLRNSGPFAWPRTDIPGLVFRALLEIAPADQSSGETPIQDAIDLPLLTIQGMSDGEMSSSAVYISAFKQFDRLIQRGSDPDFFRAVFGIYGANHRYFNTEWQQNDAPLGCVNQTPLYTDASTETGSASQRAAALVAVDNFFQATVGANKNPALASMFDTANSAPSGPVTTRAFTAANSFANSLRLEEFTAATGTNSNGFANNSNGLSTYQHRNIPGSEHDSAYLTAQIAWSGASASSNTYFQSNWASSGSGKDLRSARYLEFRVDPSDASTPGAAPVEFSVQLVNANNTLSASVPSSNYVMLRPLPGVPYFESNVRLTAYHATSKTLRIPLSLFSNANLASVRGVRFAFNRSSSGLIYLGSIRAALK